MNKTFSHHTPGEEGVQKIAKLRKAFSDLQDLIEEVSPASRERSVAITQLETTAMWAIKSVVHNDPQSKIEK